MNSDFMNANQIVSICICSYRCSIEWIIKVNKLELKICSAQDLWYGHDKFTNINNTRSLITLLAKKYYTFSLNASDLWQ